MPVGAMAEDFGLVHVYKSCMDTLGDVEYCARLVDIILELSSKRAFSYVSKRRPRTKFYLVLPRIDYSAGILVDKTKKSVVVMLYAPRHAVSLVYERNQDGGFTLTRATVSNPEYAAMTNGPLMSGEGGGL